MIGLTEKQRAVYDLIASRLRETGIAPSVAEIGAAIGTKSKGRVVEVLRALEERGHIRRLRHRARAIELVEQNRPLSVDADVRLNPEIFISTRRYALAHNISLETATNELLRAALEAA